MQVPSQNPSNMEQTSTFNIKYEFFKYFHYWPWFVFSLILFITSSFVYLRYAPKLYNTYAKIKILDDNSGIELPTTALILNRSNINLENEMEILISYPILDKVVDQLGLCAQFSEIGHVKSHSIVNLPFDFELSRSPAGVIEPNQFLITLEKSGFIITDKLNELELSFPEFDTRKSEHQLPFELKLSSSSQKQDLMGRDFKVILISKKQAIFNLKRSIKIQPIGDRSHLLNLSMIGQNVKNSERILDTLIEVFNQDDVLDRQLIWKRTIDFVDERFVDLSNELDSIESYKKNFKINNRLVDVSTDGVESLKLRAQSDEKLFQIENQIAVSNLIKGTLVNPSQSVALLPSNMGIENSSINSLLKEFNTMVLEHQKLISSAGINNPRVLLLESNLIDLKANIKNSISAYLNQLNYTKKQLSNRNQNFQSKVSGIPEKEQQLRAIERQQSIKETLFIFLLQKKEEASVNLAVTEPTLKVVENSISESLPISPRPRVVYLGSLLLGLLLPLGVYLHHSFIRH